MKVGIIGAMEPEVELLRKTVKRSQKTKVAHIDFIEGEIHGVEVVILQSGIGKVSAAIGTALLINTFKPNFIINTGSAGGFVKELDIGDIVISKDVVHHDVDVTAFGYTMGQVPQQPAAYQPDPQLVNAALKAIKSVGEVKAVEGLIGTGDSFICTPERTDEIQKHFPDIAACEMEAAAIAQTCHQMKVPFVIIRSLSDNANNDSPVDFDSYIVKAGKHSAQLVMEMLKHLSDD
tara:strand:- start:2382 stop:3083 length:702 start_codon:yes stop_codon:yes gene_type:complete